jgi:hypothetical protein
MFPIPKFLHPSAAWLFALLIPIIIFYFLKLKRNRVEVSSLVLWRQVINDQRVNAPFQKFKRNLLLLLQLVLLSLLALGAMQPFLPGEGRDLDSLPILIDCSASMGASDDSGQSRLDVAKKEISRVIDGLLPNQQLALIAVASSSRRLTEFTNNKQVLREALNSVQVEDVPSRISDGVRLAQALARTQKIQRIRFYSDGNLPTRNNPSAARPVALVDIDLPFALDYFQIPSAGRNLGITAMNARRAGLDGWDVFLRVDGSSSGSTEADVVLTSQGETIGEERVVLEAGQSQRLVFKIPADSAQRLEATLVPRSADALASDNRAWLNLPARRDLRAFCPESLGAVRHALESIAGILLNPLEAKEVSSNGYDLVISDSASDENAESPLIVLVGVVPEDLRDKIQITSEPAEVIDWQRDAPILQHVQLKEVILSEQPVKQADVDDAQLEGLGYEILAQGSRGPLILKRREESRVVYFFLFHPDRSTLPYRIGFPVLIKNIVNESLQQASLGDVQAAATGILAPMKFTPQGSYAVVEPSGRQVLVQAGDDGMLAGVSALRVGEYAIRSGTQEMERIGVSLLSSEETSLSAVEKIAFNESASAARTERLQEDRPFWAQLAMLACGLLLVEWWYFQRKPTGLPG